MVREVAESCVDGVVMEMVAAYCGRFYAAKPELAARRIEAIGFQVGHQLSERYTMERPRFSDHLEAIKFICKDFWSELFKKQIDNLKTNHRGTFVLQDNHFRWLTRVSLDPSAESTDAPDNDSAPLGDTAAQTTSMLLYFPCGLIRGALTNLGISCSVSADMSNLPAYGAVNLHCTSYINQVKRGYQNPVETIREGTIGFAWATLGAAANTYNVQHIMNVIIIMY
ncbi:trafficking protein particle complex subunit 6B [Panicum miliaceum]|uniref:Trafficking protein particle complex subunit 6B n=1 Tax=Panicum miliaceum TaxID=4540 RepID=A0A3L6QA31_PANMI|nr:trafficking protein particle complex subunit 6B [Panicum miliaceum]